MDYIQSNKAPKAVGPYSHAVTAGGFLFCSGQIALDPATGELVPGGVREQTAQVLSNLVAVLGAAGMTLENVVKTDVFLTDLATFADMNEVYAEQFGTGKPARATVEVSRLPKGALVEIACVAHNQ